MSFGEFPAKNWWLSVFLGAQITKKKDPTIQHKLTQDLPCSSAPFDIAEQQLDETNVEIWLIKKKKRPTRNLTSFISQSVITYIHSDDFVWRLLEDGVCWIGGYEQRITGMKQLQIIPNN